MSDPPLSDIDSENKKDWVCTTLKMFVDWIKEFKKLWTGLGPKTFCNSSLDDNQIFFGRIKFPYFRDRK